MPRQHKDLYEILGVDPDADRATIKSAYRLLARRYHPDVSTSKRAAERFREIHEAYSVLSDPQQRLGYDAELAVGRGRAEHTSRENVPSSGLSIGVLGFRLDIRWRW